MIIAIVFGVVIFLLLLLVLWWYRCFCCYSRKGDTRTMKERINDGIWGWTHGGRRPKPKLAGQEDTSEQDEIIKANTPYKWNAPSWMLSV